MNNTNGRMPKLHDAHVRIAYGKTFLEQRFFVQIFFKIIFRNPIVGSQQSTVNTS